MRRSLALPSCVLALALAPAALFAQTPPAQQPAPQQPPAQQPPAQQPSPEQPASQQPGAQEPAAPGTFKGEAGIIFNQIKQDQTAAFEETITRVKEALAKSTNPARKQQAAGWKVYRSPEGMGGNALYIFIIDPAAKDADYTAVGVFKILQEGLGDATAREIYERFRNAYAAPQNVLNLSPIANLGG